MDAKVSYFIRHTEGLDIMDKAIEYLWANNRIAIHYPHVKGKLENEDNGTLDIDQYEGRARQALELFLELARNGGSVWAEYRTPRGASSKKLGNRVKVGLVSPQKVEWYNSSTWKSNKYRGRTARLKTLRIQPINNNGLESRDALALKAITPRQVTMSRWPKKPASRQLLDAIIEGDSVCASWSALTTALQETACAEFLRDHDCPELPHLKRLLLPIGRTLRDLDIYGYSEEDGSPIYGQVTFDRASKVPEKIAKLKEYGKGSGRHLVFFCDGARPSGDPALEILEGIIHVPWQLVESWIKDNDPEYWKRLFEDACTPVRFEFGQDLTPAQ